MVCSLALVLQTVSSQCMNDGMNTISPMFTHKVFRTTVVGKHPAWNPRLRSKLFCVYVVNFAIAK
jgi:hypothetical protein